MGTFGEYVKSAISSIRNNKGRSFLTMLGIIIGISSVLIVLIIGDGMKATVNSEMDSIGATTISISLDSTKTDKCFSREQLRAIESNIAGIYGVSPEIDVWGTIEGKKGASDVYFAGLSEAAVNKGQLKMVHGRYFGKNDVDEDKNVCVLSQTAANRIFGYEECVGNTFEITCFDITAEFTVIGVREDNTMDIAYASYSDPPMILAEAPFTSIGASYGYDLDDTFTSFNIYLDSENKDSVLKKSRSVVENVMGIRGENAVKVSAGSGFDQTTETILNIITSVIAIIAAISLLVGGIGVMNIMTVSVTERTREIGIRKSLGARTSSILTQFLAEAAILTFTGGLIGLAIGLLISFIICNVIDFAFIVKPELVVLVIFISTSIGLFFGIYPAKRAAKLDPIEALRTE
jgi:putative ABC transport system permease protein